MNYLIMSPARCGSSWLQTTILETLKLNYVADFNPENYPNWTAEQLASQTTPWCGKLFTDEIEIYKKPVEWWQEHAHVVFIYRQDILDHFLSFIFARTSKVFNIIDNEQQPVYSSITILEEDYQFYKNIWDKFTKFTLPEDVKTLTYENMKSDIHQILDNPAEVTMKKLLTFEQKVELLNTNINVIIDRLQEITGIENIREYKWQRY